MASLHFAFEWVVVPWAGILIRHLQLLKNNFFLGVSISRLLLYNRSTMPSKGNYPNSLGFLEMGSYGWTDGAMEQS